MVLISVLWIKYINLFPRVQIKSAAMWDKSDLAGYQLLTVKEGWRGFVRVSACCLWHVCPGNKPGSIWRKLLSLVLAGWSNKFDIFQAPYFHYNWVGLFSLNIIILFSNLRIVMKILTLFFHPPQCLPLSPSDFQKEKTKGTADGTFLMYLTFEFAWNADKSYQIS